MSPLAYCQQKTATSGSSFLAGFRFLSPQKKDAITVLYAFCRELDDVVDECSDPHGAQTTLNWWRIELAKVFEDTMPEHPVCQALKPVVLAFRLPEKELEEIINGMQMDLEQVRYNTFEDLSNYCYRVAGVVGRLITRVLGFSDDRTLSYAEKMGLALQLTNIIRDVGEDARNGRIYLPIEDLEQFNVSAQTILQLKPDADFEKLMNFQIDRATKTYVEALALLPQIDQKNQKVGLIMGSIYYALLKEIKLDGAANILKYKISIPGPRKKRIALKTWLFGFKP